VAGGVDPWAAHVVYPEDRSWGGWGANGERLKLHGRFTGHPADDEFLGLHVSPCLAAEKYELEVARVVRAPLPEVLRRELHGFRLERKRPIFRT
jgi:hypothetical protein